jgi:hypothetical protein
MRALRTATRNASNEWARVRNVPVSERKRWRRTYEGREHGENVVYALREDQGIGAESRRRPSRIIRIVPTRLKGVRKRILEQVSASQSARFGKAISPRMVEKCWKEFRRIEAKLKQWLN